MSNGNFTTKKRRLDSEISTTSGISALSTLTQTTEVLNDSDDSQNTDNTDPSPSFGPILSPRFDHTVPNFPVPITAPQNIPNTQPFVNRTELPIRTRRISFNLDGDDDSTRPTTPAPPIPHHRYDNRMTPTQTNPQMMKRNRTRRATESSITGMEAAEEGRCVMHRSNTTSEFHLQQQQQQRIASQLIAEDDARRLRDTNATRRQPTLQRRSQSVNSLRGQENIYTSLQQVPVNTYVSLTPQSGSNYIHPVTHIEPQPPERIPPPNLLADRSDNIMDSTSQSSSRYARVDTVVTNPTRTCNEKNYRKGFYLLLILNVIFILLNIVGLPFVYVTIQDHEIQRDEEMVNIAFARQHDIPLCMKCNATNTKMDNFKTLGMQVDNDGKCCFPDLNVFLDGIDKKIEKSKETINMSIYNTAVYHTPMLQLKTRETNQDDKDNLIKWDRRPEFSLHGEFKTDDDRVIKVPAMGYYFIYTRIQFKIDTKACEHTCTIGHDVRKHTDERRHKDERPLGEIQEDFSPKNGTVLNHSSHLQFVHYLKKGDVLSVKQYNGKAQSHSVFGMFLLSE